MCFAHSSTDDALVYFIRVTASDSKGKTFRATFKLCILGAIQSEDFTGAAKSQFTFVIPPDTFHGPDGNRPALTAAFSEGGPLPDWLTFDGSTGEFFAHPGTGDLPHQGDCLRFQGEILSATFKLHMLGATKCEYVSGTAGSQFAFVIPQDTFHVPDGSKPALTATSSGGGPLPDWFILDGSTGKFLLTLVQTIYFIRVTALDSKDKS